MVGQAETTANVRMDALDAPGLRYEFEVAIRGGDQALLHDSLVMVEGLWLCFEVADKAWPQQRNPHRSTGSSWVYSPLTGQYGRQFFKGWESLIASLEFDALRSRLL